MIGNVLDDLDLLGNVWDDLAGIVWDDSDLIGIISNDLDLIGIVRDDSELIGIVWDDSELKGIVWDCLEPVEMKVEVSWIQQRWYGKRKEKFKRTWSWCIVWNHLNAEGRYLDNPDPIGVVGEDLSPVRIRYFFSG